MKTKDTSTGLKDHIILISNDGGGAGNAYGPYTIEEAKKQAQLVFETWCQMDEVDPATHTYPNGPWVDVLRLNNVISEQY